MCRKLIKKTNAKQNLSQLSFHCIRKKSQIHPHRNICKEKSIKGSQESPNTQV